MDASFLITLILVGVPTCILLFKFKVNWDRDLNAYKAKSMLKMAVREQEAKVFLDEYKRKLHLDA